MTSAVTAEAVVSTNQNPSSASPEPKQMTDEQIVTVLALVEAELRAAGLPEEPTSEFIKIQGKTFAVACVADLRKRVEAWSNMIVRRVKVDRSITNQQAIDATGCFQYVDVDRAVVDGMPVGEGEEISVFFIKPPAEAYDESGYISEEEVARQLDFNGLKPDPRAQAKANQDDPVFADSHPNGTQWPRPGGGYDFAAFIGWFGERRVNVNRLDGFWDDNWLFGGVPRE